MTSSPAAAPLRTVLLVDDDEVTRRFVRNLLESTRRFRVVAEAENGAEGVALAKSLSPDVVILDVEMPFMGGREALPLIRKALSNAKIVLFSGQVGEPSGRDLMSLPADALVKKDLECATLVPALLSIDAHNHSSVDRRHEAVGKRAAS